MRQLLILLILAFSFVHITQAQVKTARELENLFGLVKTISAEQANYLEPSSEREDGRRKQLDTVTFNRKGDEVERVIYDDYGFLVGKKTLIYDAQSKLVSDSLVDDKGVILSRNIYTYDANAKRLESTSFEENESLKQRYIYDVSNKLKEEVYLYKDKVVGKTVYKYDERGNPVEIAFFRPGNKKAVAPVGPCFNVHKLNYIYDAKDRPTKVVAYEPDDSIKRTTSYVFDDKSNIAEEVRDSDYSKLYFTHRYEYDTHGNWIKRITKSTSHSNLGNSSHERVIMMYRKITYFD